MGVLRRLGLFAAYGLLSASLATASNNLEGVFNTGDHQQFEKRSEQFSGRDDKVGARFIFYGPYRVSQGESVEHRIEVTTSSYQGEVQIPNPIPSESRAVYSPKIDNSVFAIAADGANTSGEVTIDYSSASEGQRSFFQSSPIGDIEDKRLPQWCLGNRRGFVKRGKGFENSGHLRHALTSVFDEDSIMSVYFSVDTLGRTFDFSAEEGIVVERLREPTQVGGQYVGKERPSKIMKLSNVPRIYVEPIVFSDDFGVHVISPMTHEKLSVFSSDEPFVLRSASLVNNNVLIEKDGDLYFLNAGAFRTRIDPVNITNTDDINESHAFISPGGSNVFYLQGNDAYILSSIFTEGGIKKKLFNDQVDPSGSNPWSPDEKYLAFTSGGELRVYSFERDSVWRITTPGNKRSVTWSPYGGRLSYISDGKLGTIRPDGTGESIISEGPVSSYSWGENDSELFYSINGKVRMTHLGTKRTFNLTEGIGDFLEDPMPINSQYGRSVICRGGNGIYKIEFLFSQ